MQVLVKSVFFLKLRDKWRIVALDFLLGIEQMISSRELYGTSLVLSLAPATFKN